MRLIAFINPNSTEAMTESCALSLGEVAAGAFELRAVTNHDGPPAIQGEADGKAAVPGLLKAIESNDDCDGFILGCFDDTGLFEARAMTAKPVIGIGQAAFHMAALRYGRFHVLTTLQASVPVIQENIARQGFSGSCAAVLASDLPVLELEHNPDHAIAILSGHISAIEQRDSNATIVLGCAGMTVIHEQLQFWHSATLIDPVISAGCLIRALI